LSLELLGDFDNYRALERIQHCMFNTLATLSFKTEEHFLKQRLLERLRQSADEDFENKL
jgi:cob(I)alamin adenosyltransferase